MASVSVAELLRAIAAGEEVALLDVRDQWAYCQGHALLASNCPPASLELQIERLAPCRRTRVVLMDDGDPATGSGLVDWAQRRLRAMGYSRVELLAAGLAGWRAAGYHAFTGIHVIGKLLGELVEHRCDTPTIDAEPQPALPWRDGRALLIDVRPAEEFEHATVPGSINIPAGDLLRTDLDTLGAASDRPLIVHCGGRTRGIIAAQTLIEADPARSVAVLRDGTIGWRLAGGLTVAGQTSGPRLPTRPIEQIRSAAQALLRRARVDRLSPDALGRLLDQRERRTIYFVDVRDAEAFRLAAHPAALHLPAGQLLQEMDTLLAVRNAEVVLFDDLGDRAAIAAHWLHQAGWTRISWVCCDDCTGELLSGAAQERIPALASGWRYVDALELAHWLSIGRAKMLDLSSSPRFEQARIPGAVFAMRSALVRVQPDRDEPALLGGGGQMSVVLTCENGQRAAWVTHDFGDGRLSTGGWVLRGGNAAWRAAGLPVESGSAGVCLHPPHDVRRSIYDEPERLVEAMRGYIEWETALPAQARNEAYLSFVAPDRTPASVSADSPSGAG